MSQPQKFDLIILGGGLSGSLLFASLNRAFPNWKVLLCERSAQLCGDHTWSFHSSDLPEDLRPLVEPLVSQQWPAYEVQFPEFSRKLESTYASIRSQDLAGKIEKLAGSNFTILKDTLVNHFNNSEVHTSKGVFVARYVIDCRGWTALTGPLGYQKFIGLEIQFKKPHGLEIPILKDARVEQTDGYRFVYSLPMTTTNILIEDTYYSNTPEINDDVIYGEILKYAERFGEVDSIVHAEKGCLPLALSTQKTDEEHITLGARSQFYQPVTGYSLPQTLQMLNQLLKQLGANQSTESILKSQKEYLAGKSFQWTYFMWLNKMLFLAAEPHLRYQVLQRFYTLDEDLIHRFYRGELRTWDQLRILMGKPPVPVLKAMKVLLTKNHGLETTKA